MKIRAEPEATEKSEMRINLRDLHPCISRIHETNKKLIIAVFHAIFIKILRLNKLCNIYKQ